MKSLLREILITLLYLTPIGYALSLFKLSTGERTPGVYIDLPRDKPISVIVKKDPLPIDRIHWFINGVFLLSQTFVIISRKLGGDLGYTYAWIASVFGVVNLVSAFFPNFNWNGTKPFNILKISPIWILLIFLLVFTVAYFDVFRWLLGLWR